MWPKIYTRWNSAFVGCFNIRETKRATNVATIYPMVYESFELLVVSIYPGHGP